MWDTCIKLSQISKGGIEFFWDLSLEELLEAIKSANRIHDEEEAYIERMKDQQKAKNG